MGPPTHTVLAPEIVKGIEGLNADWYKEKVNYFNAVQHFIHQLYPLIFESHLASLKSAGW